MPSTITDRSLPLPVQAAGELYSAQNPISASGLSAMPSRLSRLQAHAFFGSSSITDCIGSLFRGCMRLLERLFSYFFSPKSRPVQAVPVQDEPLTSSDLEGRAASVKDQVREQLQTKKGVQQLGLLPDIVHKGKVAVLLKYNTQFDLCSQNIHNADSLEQLKTKVFETIDTIMHHPDNSRARSEIFSVITIAMSNFQTLDAKKSETVPIAQKQSCRVAFTANVNHRASKFLPESREIPCKKEEFKKDIIRSISFPGIDPGRISQIEKGIELFFFGTSTRVQKRKQ
jgi:hypothetical protein